MADAGSQTKPADAAECFARVAGRFRLAPWADVALSALLLGAVAACILVRGLIDKAASPGGVLYLFVVPVGGALWLQFRMGQWCRRFAHPEIRRELAVTPLGPRELLARPLDRVAIWALTPWVVAEVALTMTIVGRSPHEFWALWRFTVGGVFACFWLALVGAWIVIAGWLAPGRASGRLRAFGIAVAITLLAYAIPVWFYAFELVVGRPFLLVLVVELPLLAASVWVGRRARARALARYAVFE